MLLRRKLHAELNSIDMTFWNLNLHCSCLPFRLIAMRMPVTNSSTTAMKEHRSVLSANNRICRATSINDRNECRDRERLVTVSLFGVLWFYHRHSEWPQNHQWIYLQYLSGLRAPFPHLDQAVLLTRTSAEARQCDMDVVQAFAWQGLAYGFGMCCEIEKADWILQKHKTKGGTRPDSKYVIWCRPASVKSETE